MVAVIKKVRRVRFRNMPFGAQYWTQGALNVAPSTKHNRRNAITGYSTTTGRPTLTAVANTSVVVVRVPAGLQPSRITSQR